MVDVMGGDVDSAGDQGRVSRGLEDKRMGRDERRAKESRVLMRRVEYFSAAMPWTEVVSAWGLARVTSLGYLRSDRLTAATAACDFPPTPILSKDITVLIFFFPIRFAMLICTARSRCYTFPTVKQGVLAFAKKAPRRQNFLDGPLPSRIRSDVQKQNSHSTIASPFRTQQSPFRCLREFHLSQTIRFLHQAADMEHRAFIALGSNLGDRVSMIEKACKEMDATGKIHVLRTSSLWETKAMYVLDQDKFVNGVCEVSLPFSLTIYT